MEYFSGLAPDMKITFGWMMTISTIAILIFIYGMYLNLKKWGYGSEGYGMEPSNGSVLTFLKTFIVQLSQKGHAHAQPLWKVLILDILLQRRIWRKHPVRWFMHITIFVGWMALFALSLGMFLVELIYLAGFNISPEAVREMVQLPAHWFSVMLTIGILIAIFRRVFVPKIRESTIAYDSILLFGLAFVVFTGFLANGARIGEWWGFGIDFQYAPPLALFHSVISLLICIAFIPFSKYIHVIATPLAIIANKGGE
ncbi:CoB--CoM heterodisulfide reductase [Methanosalsum zhilinae DSM 4017]|uniref:CoB--CoM heterodisulfide reductase n=1 Tax=Methanosalsum zhilinae (strain DSM 4017 / NBRC 107636 / OCM 62 / WeN5) TaxID=679901 RepID=F7XQG3_METZD|nr:respiratory nitrate reductase subunit gamma [Methanosalsum zhilinae]AEH60464.1 CoB--CoM heterodisulfide reductase [Methanosalsum zhilinae DSM 4017]